MRLQSSKFVKNYTNLTALNIVKIYFLFFRAKKFGKLFFFGQLRTIKEKFFTKKHQNHYSLCKNKVFY